MSNAEVENSRQLSAVNGSLIIQRRHSSLLSEGVNDFLGVPCEDRRLIVFSIGSYRLAGGFSGLSKEEQVAVAAYVKREYDRVVFQQPNSYLSKNAQSDPEAWQVRLRELIARDEKRGAALVQIHSRDNDEV